jgi:hypothetical protein
MKRPMCFAFSLVALALGIVIAGCGGGGYTPPPPPPPNITVTIAVANNTTVVEAGSSVGITAVANGDTYGKGVTWSLSPMLGTLTNMTSSSVTYNAPATPPPSDVLVTITATSVADPTKSNNVSVTVPAITVSLSANPNTVGATGTSTITATVSNDPANKGVDPTSWKIASPASGGGTLSTPTSTTVTYTAPATPPPSDVQVTIQATSASDPTKTAPPVGITFAAIAVSLSANPLLVGATGTSTITATVSFDPANAGVNPASWAMTSPAPAVGALSNRTSTTVTYTAPATPPPSDVPVIIQATSVTDPSKSNTVTITFKAIAVSVTPAFVTVAEDTTQPFTPTVSFDPSNMGVNWTLTQGAPPLPCSQGCGTISAASSASGTPITYTAPSVVPTPVTVTLTATSVADTTKSGSAIITVVNPDSALKGQYAFLFHGFDDATGKQVAVVGSFTADGFGNITNGLEDINGPSGPQTSVTFTGTYIIGLDNRGTATFAKTLGGSVTYAFAVGSLNSGGVATKARMIEFDDATGTAGTRGSGFMRLQDPTAFSLTKITGPYGFGISGQDSSGGRIAAAGLFSADGAGNISGGTEDINDTGTVTNSVIFTGTYTAPDATNGRVTGTISTSSPAQITHFSLYVVSASEAFLMTTDAESTSGLESGSVLSQASTPYTNSSLNAASVFYEVGVKAASTTQSDVRIGQFAPNGSGSLAITSDENDGGVITANSTTSGLTYSVASNGRVTLSGGSGSQPILYLVDTNKAFFLGADASVGFGFLEPQSGGSFGPFSITGNYFSGVAPPAVTPSTVSSGVGIANHFRRCRFFCGPINTLSVTQDSSSSNGTLTSGGTGFSQFVVSLSGRTITTNGAVIYIISPSKFVRIDESTADVAPTVSIFEK